MFYFICINVLAFNIAYATVSIKPSTLKVVSPGNEISFECITTLELKFGDSVELQKYIPDRTKESFLPGSNFTLEQLKIKVPALPQVFPIVASTKLNEPFIQDRFKLPYIDQGINLVISQANLNDTGLYRCVSSHRQVTSEILSETSSWFMLIIESENPILKVDMYQSRNRISSTTILYNSSLDSVLSIALHILSTSSLIKGKFIIQSNSLGQSLVSNNTIVGSSWNCGSYIWKDRMCYQIFTYFVSTQLPVGANPQNYHEGDLQIKVNNSLGNTIYTNRFLLHDRAAPQTIDTKQHQCSSLQPITHLTGESIIMGCHFPKIWHDKRKLKMAWRISHPYAFQPGNFMQCVYPEVVTGCPKSTNDAQSYTFENNPSNWQECDVTDRMIDMKDSFPERSDDNSCSRNMDLQRIPRIRFLYYDGGNFTKYALKIVSVYSVQIQRTFELLYEGFDDVEQGLQLNRKFQLSVASIKGAKNDASTKGAANLLMVLASFSAIMTIFGKH